jgi:signal transduction histidine kinase
LENRLIELSETDNLKQFFLTTIIHHLRTPLSGIRWAVKEMISAPNPNHTEQKATLEQIDQKLQESMDLITEVISISKFNLSEIKTVVKKEKISLSRVLENTIDDSFRAAEKNNVSIIKSIEPDVDILGDRRILGFALNNLIDNAIRYSPGGQVTINLSKNNNQAEISIKDTGMGISTDDLKHVFTKFFRGSNAANFDSKENGVGLYSSKIIFEMFDGGISINSSLNQGTEVKVFLPCERGL